MNNLIAGLIFSIFISPSNLSDTCKNYYPEHPVRSNIMLQVLLKSYGYYEGKIDGIFGNVSKKALISLQKLNNLDADGKIGPQTCSLLLNKRTIVKNSLLLTSNTSIDSENSDNTYSQEIYDAQIILKDLGLYLSTIDGLNGPGTKNAVREFQTKAGLVSDGVIGNKTKEALSKGEDSYVNIIESTQQNNVSSQQNSEIVIYGLDLRNYDPSKPCVEGYVDTQGIWGSRSMF